MEKNIQYGASELDGNGKKIDVNITSVNFDNFNHTINIVKQVGLEVKHINITIEYAEKIGFINFNALKQFCK